MKLILFSDSVGLVFQSLPIRHGEGSHAFLGSGHASCAGGSGEENCSRSLRGRARAKFGGQLHDHGFRMAAPYGSA